MEPVLSIMMLDNKIIEEVMKFSYLGLLKITYGQLENEMNVHVMETKKYQFKLKRLYD